MYDPGVGLLVVQRNLLQVYAQEGPEESRRHDQFPQPVDADGRCQLPEAPLPEHCPQRKEYHARRHPDRGRAHRDHRRARQHIARQHRAGRPADGHHYSQRNAQPHLLVPAGIGGHANSTIKACVERGLKPDFWMKTLHHTRYWSAKPKPKRDNIWCEDPEGTVALMASRPEPWIAFKTLAAGAIHPKVGFPYAFKGGADFLCVGMYDFQIVDDVNLALTVLGGDLKRQRPWRA